MRTILIIALLIASPINPALAQESKADSTKRAEVAELSILESSGENVGLVKGVQRTLNARHAILLDHPLKVDGLYLAKTRDAIRAFQESKDIGDKKGTLDEETLHELAPLYPSSTLLQFIMKSVENYTGGKNISDHIAAFIACILILGASFIAYRMAKEWVGRLTRLLAAASTTTWDDALVEENFFGRISLFAPAALVYVSSGLFESDSNARAYFFESSFQGWYVLVSRAGLGFMAIAGILVAEAFVRTCERVYAQVEPGTPSPMHGIVQATRMLIYFAGIILVIAAIAGENPIRIVAGFGAFMAIILLVFKDTILGLVASIQIITNKLVEIGDWVEMPKYNADGDVQAITLTTIKVQNFDKTVSAIPTHAIMSDSFRNWSAMKEAGGRRIKRSIYIDMDTIRVCSEQLLQQLERAELLTDYIQSKRFDLEKYNQEHAVDASVINSRRLTNIGTFRAYVKLYLESRSELRDDLTCLVRQLPATSSGLPVEIYAFSRETDWSFYEDIQSDIFDHLLAILPEFGLRAFQEVSSSGGEASSDAENHNEIPYDLEVALEQERDNLRNDPKLRLSTSRRRIKQLIKEKGLGDRLTVSANGQSLILEHKAT